MLAVSTTMGSRIAILAGCGAYRVVTPIRTALLLIVFLCCALIALPCFAQESSHVEVEFTPGVAIPFNNFVASSSADSSVVVDSGVGFGFGLNLALDNWEFRYALSVLPTRSITVRWTPAFVDKWNTTVSGTVLEPLQVEPNDGAGGLKSTSDGGAISIHNAGIGYRIPLTSGDLRVFIPVGVGLAVTTSSTDTIARTLYGFTAQTGIGVSYAVLPWLNVGAQMRYLFTVSENTTEVATASALINARLSRDAIESAYILGHLLHLTATLSAEF